MNGNMNSSPGSARKVTFRDEPEVKGFSDSEKGSKLSVHFEDELVGPAKKVNSIEGKLLIPKRRRFINASPEVNKVESSTNVQNAEDHETFADKLKSGSSVAQPKFRYLESAEKFQGSDVVLPRKSLESVQQRLAFTLYGYFLGERIAYPVVEQFVRLNWKKFGLQKVMMNANGFFFFKFSDNKGMLDVLEGGPWLIRNKPIFLNKWTPSQTLAKKEIKKAAVWVKFHDVPLAAYSDDGLSMLASKIGSPNHLDTYTIAMCEDLWGRSSYARALIEISAEHDFKEILSIAIPDLEGVGFVTENVRVEYEWKPPRCGHYGIFGHHDCQKQKMAEQTMPITKADPIPKTTKKQPKVVDKDGFMKVPYRKIAKKSGLPLKEQKSKVVYKPLNYQKMVAGAPSSSAKGKEQVKSNNKSHNSFEALNGLAYEDLSDLEVDAEFDEYSIPPVCSGASTSPYVSNG